MSFEILESIALTTAAAGLSSSIASLLKSYAERRKNVAEETIEQRIGKLTHSLQQTSHLISTIEAEIQSRTALATKLREDVERYNQLKALNQQQVEAIAQTLRGELKVEGRKNFWSGFWLNFGFFALGALFSYLIK